MRLFKTTRMGEYCGGKFPIAVATNKRNKTMNGDDYIWHVNQ